MSPSAPLKKYSLREKLPDFSPHVARFLADQPELERQVVFRMLPATAPPADRQLFLLELEDLLNLDHPAFTPVYDHGTTRGHPFYLVPFREHRNVWNLVKKGTTDLATRQAIALSLAEAFEAAHHAGMVLGPPSPLALAWDSPRQQVQYIHHRAAHKVRRLPYPKTMSQKVLDSVHWTPSTDVFHWAYFSYWLISGGELPFPASALQVPIREHVPELDRRVAHVLDGCLSAKDETRPTHAGEIVALLNEVPEPLGETWDGTQSGTIPQAEIAAQIELLKASGQIAVIPQRAVRTSLRLQDSPHEIEGIPCLPDSKTSSLQTALSVMFVAGIGWALIRPTAPLLPPSSKASLPRRASERHKPPKARTVHTGLARLRRLRRISPGRFSSVWRQIRDLSAAGELPSELSSSAQVEALMQQFRANPRAGCLAVRAYLDRLEELLAEGAGAPP